MGRTASAVCTDESRMIRLQSTPAASIWDARSKTRARPWLVGVDFLLLPYGFEGFTRRVRVASLLEVSGRTETQLLQAETVRSERRASLETRYSGKQYRREADIFTQQWAFNLRLNIEANIRRTVSTWTRDSRNM